MSVRELLDEYYRDVKNIKREEIKAFSACIDNRADSILEGYENALMERKNAEELDYETEHVVIVFEDGTTYEDVKEITSHISEDVWVLTGNGGSLEKCIDDGIYYKDRELIVKLSIGISMTVSQAMEVLENVEGIAAVEKNGYLEFSSLNGANDPYKAQQHYLETINVYGAWEALTSSYNYNFKKKKVAVIDSGVDIEHEDLKNMVSEDSVAFEAGGTVKSLFKCQNSDIRGHGTRVAGVIAAESNNLVGATGITSVYNSRKNQVENWCEIMALKLTDEKGRYDFNYAADAVDYAVAHGADVINMSFSGSAESTKLRSALRRAHNAGVVLVAAAGNNGTPNPSYPACYENVLSVASLREDGMTGLTGSNYGPGIDISAIGDNMLLLVQGSKTEAEINPDFMGTSFAAPQVSAAAALLKAVAPDMFVGMIEYILVSTADDIGPSGRDDGSGYGRLNVDRAVRYAKRWKYLEDSGKSTDVIVTLKNFNTARLSIEIPDLTEYFEIRRGEYVNGEIVYTTIADHVCFDDAENGRVAFEDADLEWGKTYYYQVIDRIDSYYGTEPRSYTRNNNPAPIQLNFKSGKMSLRATSVNISEYPELQFVYDGLYAYFVLLRSDSYDGEYQRITVTNNMKYTDTSAKKGKTYFYKAYAMYAVGGIVYNSEESDALCILVPQ